MSRPRERVANLLVLAGFAVTIWVTVVVASSPGRQWPAWMLLSVGGILGFAGAVCFAFAWIIRPLLAAARACDRVAAGDLSESLAEVGPAPLRLMAKVFNTVLADFQEVLLLFAYFLRSAQTSIQVLREQADGPGAGNAVRSLCASTLDDLRSMQEMIEGFRYFRVRIESGTVTDSGVRLEGGEEDSNLRSTTTQAPIPVPAPRV